MKKIVFLSVIAAVLALGIGLAPSPPAQAEDGTFARGYPQSSWPTVADEARISQLASKALQDVLRDLYRTSDSAYADVCTSGGFLCAAGTGFNVLVGAGTCLYDYATGADAEHSRYRVVYLSAAEAATDWEANPGAATYYVHVGYGEATAAGIEAPDPVITVDTDASLAGTTTVCSVVVAGAEPSAATYSYNDLRVVGNGLHYAPTAGTVNASALQIGGVAVGASAAELNAVADLSAVGMLPRVCALTVDSAGERTEGAHAICTLPATAIVTDLYVGISTQETSGTTTVDIGPAGTAAGFANDLSVAAAGLLRPGVALDGGSAYYNTATRGTLLATLVQGASADDRGLYYEFPNTSSGGLVVSYTVPAGGWTEFAGTILVQYLELP